MQTKARIMRLHSLLAACFVAGACVLFAPSARADSFFVTFTSGTTPVGSRVQGATFEATSVATPSGPRPNPVKIEIDDWSIFQPTLAAANARQLLTAKIEFTTPNAQGQEEVYMIATYENAALTRVVGTYDAAATAKVKEALELVYGTVRYSPPKLKLGEVRPPIRSLPSSAPSVRRVERAVAISQRVDDAYFQAPTIPGESADHPGQIRLLGFVLEGTNPQGVGPGQTVWPLVLSPVTITKTPGAATQAFQTAATTGKIIDPMTITLVQHHGTQPDTISKTLVLSKAYVATAGLQAGAPAVEKVTVLPTTVLKLTAGTVTTEVAATPSQHH